MKKVARFKKFQYLCTEEVRKGQFIPSLKEGVFLPKIDKKYNGTPKVWANINEIYELNEFACGRQNKEGAERCCAGHPMETCSYITAGARKGEKWRDWSYEEPVKCACWDLDEIRDIDNVSIPIDVAVRLFDGIVKLI